MNFFKKSTNKQRLTQSVLNQDLLTQVSGGANGMEPPMVDGQEPPVSIDLNPPTAIEPPVSL